MRSSLNSILVPFVLAGTMQMGWATSGPMWTKNKDLKLDRPAIEFARKDFAPMSQTLKDSFISGDETTLIGALSANPKWIRSYVYDGYTPVHLAAQAGQTKVLKWLLDHRAQVDLLSDLGLTPLHVAKNGVVAKMLIEAGADRNNFPPGDPTPMQRAASFALRSKRHSTEASGADLRRWDVEDRQRMSDQIRVVNTIAQSGVPPDPYSALYIGQATTARKLVRADPKAALSFELNGKTLMHVAAQKGDLETVKLLLSFGMDIDADLPGSESEKGQTPLAEAVAAGQIQTARFLLMTGANPNKVALNAYAFWTQPHPRLDALIQRCAKLRPKVKPRTIETAE